ncbi:GDSL-like Lipase/Acylhydrolase family protein [Striga asiatica]|uniref:GDSL-like Lipase/Acylhydrolase family protein n=1 Tax=Striga asiatica TaxID=4170 RepID=A0A5A7P605_STRAF|nr:GDSL-like Lipase/Acylhydrolase family protein [Striga asiatica]
MMKVKIKNHSLVKRCFYLLIICFFPILLAAGDPISIRNVKCPFDYLYHFGDGATDTGNSIRRQPFGPFLPAAHLPYGRTFRGQPTGRWSNGRVEFDYTASYLGLTNNVPYLAINNRGTNDSGVIFAVARSPVLDTSFFTERSIQIPPYVVPLSNQLIWFKNYLKTICSTPQDCRERLRNSLLFMGDNEANDIGYALVQGISIQEASTYIPTIIRAIINATIELINMGANRIVIPGSGPLGCYPYMLTALPDTNPFAYDLFGCLKSVNNLIISKNAALQAEILKLTLKFPTTQILYADIYKGVTTVLQQDFSSGKLTVTKVYLTGNLTLKACCGVGGKYNYSSTRFCGSPGVPVCPNPNQYIYWDGLHYTQEAYFRYLQPLVFPTLIALNCTFI